MNTELPPEPELAPAPAAERESYQGPPGVAPQSVLSNFIEKYGAATLLAMQAGIEAGENNQDWADRLGVSRERVRQWRALFFTERLILTLRPGLALE
jgi:hypothetical protein